MKLDRTLSIETIKSLIITHFSAKWQHSYFNIDLLILDINNYSISSTQKKLKPKSIHKIDVSYEIIVILRMN